MFRGRSAVDRTRISGGDNLSNSSNGDRARWPGSKAAEKDDKSRRRHEEGEGRTVYGVSNPPPHTELDEAVAPACDWPANLKSEEILDRLVSLNAERAREERSALIRWLRPEYRVLCRAD